MSVAAERPRGGTLYVPSGRIWTADRSAGTTEFPLPDNVAIGTGVHADPATPNVAAIFQLLAKRARRRSPPEMPVYAGISMDLVAPDDLAERMSVTLPLPGGTSTFGLRFDRPICWLWSGRSGTDETTADSGRGLIEVRSQAVCGLEWHLIASSDSVPHLRTLRVDLSATGGWPPQELSASIRSEAALGPALNLDLDMCLDREWVAEEDDA